MPCPNAVELLLGRLTTSASSASVSRKTLRPNYLAVQSAYVLDFGDQFRASAWSPCSMI